MKKILILLLAISPFFASAQSGLLNGTGYAPNFTVTDLNGISHTIYDYLDSGKVVVLELMSVTCGHCQSHAAGTENSYQTNGPNGTDAARFLGLEVNSSTDSAAVANFASTYGVTMPIANNVSPTAINYQLYYTPGYYIIYPDSSYTTICAAYCVTSQNYATIEGLLNDAITLWQPPIYGCTNPLAVNYDSTATIDNDSCDFTSYTITTIGMSFSPDTIICDVGDTINFILGGYHNAVEVSDSTWIAGGSSPLFGGFSFGYGATGMFIPDDCHTFYYVCQPHASSGMKGVIIAHHPPVFGCTDPTACNYDSLATIDDSSCE
ncbi:redoxin domain-containing protein, partial [Flavobacteriales bacterium]|nr:redoxin domain-containing protein [Flavobacteriales bacterium]